MKLIFKYSKTKKKIKSLFVQQKNLKVIKFKVSKKVNKKIKIKQKKNLEKRISLIYFHKIWALTNSLHSPEFAYYYVNVLKIVSNFFYVV